VESKKEELNKLAKINCTKNQKTSVDIIKSQYYTHFISEVNFVKDMIRHDVEHYKFESNDPRVRDFLSLIQRVQKLLKILPKNLGKELYETKCKKLEKICDTAMLYCEEDGRVKHH